MNFGNNKNSLHTVKRQECRKLDWFRSSIFASVCWVLILLRLNFLGSQWLIMTLPLPTFWISETLHTRWSLLSGKPAPQASEKEVSFFPHFVPWLPNPEEGRHTHTYQMWNLRNAWKSVCLCGGMETSSRPWAAQRAAKGCSASGRLMGKRLGLSLKSSAASH